MIGSNEKQLTVFVKKKVNSEKRRFDVSIDWLLIAWIAPWETAGFRVFHADRFEYDESTRNGKVVER